jgi:hypothetical protein
LQQSSFPDGPQVAARPLQLGGDVPLSLPFFWNTTVPVRVGLAICGVQVIVLPETQYEYFASLSNVSTLLAVA